MNILMQFLFNMDSLDSLSCVVRASIDQEEI